MSQLFASDGPNIGISASASVLSVNTQVLTSAAYILKSMNP